MKPLYDLGVLPVRYRTGKGFKPHISLTFKTEKNRTFAVDTTNLRNSTDAYLITHAHSDHHGKSAMLCENSVCSEETARALEILYGKKFTGSTFRIGDVINISGVHVKTYPTHHTIGSTAFFWENEVGTRILVTGDVKDAKDLPKCDLLVTEANYGDYDDPACHFQDDIGAFREAVKEHDDIALGAYSFGKAQRAVHLLRESGYSGKIGMDPTSLSLTEGLMENAGQLCGLDDDCGIRIAALAKLSGIKASKKYLLTCRRDHKVPTISISDHMDVNGLIGMVEQCAPQAVIVYHPSGHRPVKLAAYINKMGVYARALEQINNCIEI